MATRTSSQSGNWSSSATWGGNPPPGDGDIANIFGGFTVTIDQNIGTAGNGIHNINLKGTSTILNVDSSSARTIIFGSTGTNPVGSGSDGNPGADATMFGFFIGSGFLDLEGTAAHPVTITTQDDSHPTFINHQFGDLSEFDVPSQLKMRYVNAKHLGTNTSYFLGIFWNLRAVTSIDVQNCNFPDFYQFTIDPASRTTPITIAFNYFSTVRSSNTIYFPNDPYAGTGIITDNTEDTPTVTGTFLFLLYNATNGVTFERNAVSGTASIPKQLFSISAFNSGNGGYSIKNNFVFNAEGNGSSNYSIFFNDTTNNNNINGNVVNGGYGSLDLGSGFYPTLPFPVQNNWFLAYKEQPLQGLILIPGGVYSVTYNIIIVAPESVNPTVSPPVGLFVYNNVSQGHFDNNTVYFGSIQTVDSSGIFFGEGGFPSHLNYGRNNIAYGAYNGISTDTSASDAFDVATAGYNGAGVHHNDVFNSVHSYSLLHGIGFDNGVTPHPNALYGDVSADPKFLDPTRRPAGWDTSLGGAGTVTNVFTQLAKRSGLNGTYNTSYNIPAMLSWLQFGFSPTNPALHNTGYNGADIGAVPFLSMGGGSSTIAMSRLGMVSDQSMGTYNFNIT